MERSSRVLQHGNPKTWFSFQKRSKLNFDYLICAEVLLNQPCFDDMSPTIVIHASMERSSRVLQHGIPPNFFFFFFNVVSTFMFCEQCLA